MDIMLLASYVLSVKIKTLLICERVYREVAGQIA
jgi:hypothetical protein